MGLVPLHAPFATTAAAADIDAHPKPCDPSNRSDIRRMAESRVRSPMSTAVKPAHFFHIDVLGNGVCNLRCPSCPVGNWPEAREPKGTMSPGLLRRVLDKAAAETTVTGVGLFNWTEPLLHPRIGELVEIVGSYGMACHLSSNLNDVRRLEEALVARPTSFRVSISGFRQPTYGKTHAGGDVEVVKRNLDLLAALRARHTRATDVHVLYHRYADNLLEELELRDLAARLDFRFVAIWAFMMPLEKVLAYIESDPSLATLTDQDRATIEGLGLPLADALEAARGRRDLDCKLQSEQMTLDCKGNVQLCCAVFDSSRFFIGNFLETPLEELRRRKVTHSMCARCTNRGAHVYYMIAAPEFADIAERRLEAAQREVARRFPAFNAG
jgi:wyosine [tRNA(Phe)-imidazoG37] synthetase (radical SAM superfamily)